MLSEIKFESPLAGLGSPRKALEHGDIQRVHLRELPFVPLTNLRVDPNLPKAQQAVRRLAGLELPLKPNTVEQSAHCVAMWLAPDEWLLRWRQDEQAATLTLEQELSGTFCAVNELGNGYSVLALSGPLAADVLNKGCPLDLHPRVFGPRQCAQSHFFKAGVLIRRVSIADEGAWEIVVRRSFADYTARIMLDAMQEYLV